MKIVESRSPQRSDDVVVSVPSAGANGVVAAVGRARAAQREWAAGPVGDRAAALTQAANRILDASEELAALAVREVGKPISEARAEVHRTGAILRYYAQQVFDPIGAVHEPSGTGLLYTRRRPRGVAGLITPWNFPYAIPIWKAAPALAAGNAVVLKPSPQATACALRLFELAASSFPAGLLAVTPGHTTEGQAVAATTDVVSFTGSLGAGMMVAGSAATRGLPVQAEMGGQNPSIVLPDADMTRTARHIVSAAYGFAGQKCTATKRIIAVGAAIKPLTEALLVAIAEISFGEPTDPQTICGPVIDEVACRRVLLSAASAKASGAQILVGGTASDNYVRPTLVSDASATHELALNEVFGPICLLQHAPDLTSAVTLANSTAFGLVSAVFTNDLNQALYAAEGLRSGLVKVNAPTAGIDFYLPFGGEKSSSYGPPEQGKFAMDFFSTTRTIAIQTT